MSDSKNNGSVDIATKRSYQNSQYTKNSNQGNVHKASDILNIVKKNTSKKGSD